METKNLIAVELFCANYNIEISFINLLKETCLIEIKQVKDTGFIEIEQLKQLEKYIRFYYDLDINPEGIATITHLLNRINSLQDEITELKNRLRLYEINE